MAQEYLPAPSNVRLADLMKEHNISQPELAKEIGCSKSTISRFISGAKGTLTHEQVLKIARLFNVSTDFLLGETNIPDRKNYDIAELGLSVEAAKNLYTGRINTEVVNLLLENARFAELTYRIAQYFDDTFASGIAAQNAMLTTLSTLLRTKVKTPEAAKAAKDIGFTSLAIPEAWLGSTTTGRCVISWSIATAERSRVFLVAVSKVLMPRSQSITFWLPSAIMYSALIRNS